MENKKIVVLGGSFNPPTKAHKSIMRSAMDTIGATKGLFVPSSAAYVARKMSRVVCDNQVYDEDLRFKMLSAMLDEDMDVSTVEYGDDGRGHTYETLCRIQSEYEDCEIWFIVGDDKLGIMPRWRHHDELFEKFKFVVLTRRGDNVEHIILDNPALAKHADNFVICKSDGAVDGISSTRCRQLINDKAWTVLQTYMEKDVLRYCMDKGGN